MKAYQVLAATGDKNDTVAGIWGIKPNIWQIKLLFYLFYAD